MEEAAAAQVVVEDNGSAGKGGVELLYEDIEAPKFVDFTAADHYNPDDRYWFCARVGCDLRHEQEIDLEEINKNFILRVMAARSPNVKLRRALTAKSNTINSSTTTRKCPLTAPSKPSRPKMSRLAVLSSVSRKLLLDGKERPVQSANPITTATPKKQARAKKSVAVTGDALTTPRCKKRAVKPELFRSVRNPQKREEAALVSSEEEEEQNNRIMVAKKALSFTSPKKKKNFVDTTTDDACVRNICRGMKKLDINGGQRLPLPSNTNGASSRKKMGAREVKSRVYDAFKSRNCKKGKENDSLLRRRRPMKEKQEESQVSISLVVCHGSSSSSGGESSDMEVDENSNRGSSIDRCSLEESELFEVPIVQDCLDDLRSKLPVQVEQLLSSSDGVGSCCNHGEEDITDKEKDAQENVGSEAREKEDVGGDHCGNTLTAGDVDEDILESDDKENTSGLDHNNREQNTGRNILGIGKQAEKDAQENVGSEAREKEDVGGDHCGNTLTAGDVDEDILESDDKENTSGLDHNNREQNTGRNILGIGKQAEKPGKSQKGRLIISKEAATADVKSGGGGKHSKPRPTNPKPFRLRTDERRVLKEANLEKKILLTPVKEMNSVAVVTSAAKKGGSHGSQAQGRVSRSKQQGLSQRITPTQNTEKRQLSVIKETAALNLKTATPIKKKTEEVNTKKSAAAAACSDSCWRSVSRGGRIQRRPTTTTIPREPHFHTVSVPKTCCTKKWVT